jgi:hypothetical protein
VMIVECAAVHWCSSLHSLHYSVSDDIVRVLVRSKTVSSSHPSDDASRSPSIDARCSVRFTPLFVVSCAVILIEHEKAWKQTVCVLVRVLYTISPSCEYGLS